MATSEGGYLIADTDNHRVRRVSASGRITTVAGNGSPGFSGDRGQATSAELRVPRGVAVTADGAVLIADTGNHRVRRVSKGGKITTVAGNGSPGFSGDGGSAATAQLHQPLGLAVPATGGFLIADTSNSRVRRVSAAGKITTVAGSGSQGFSGDGGAAVAARLDRPFAVASSADGGFVIADTANSRVRYVSKGRRITIVAGTGTVGFGGDGGPAPAGLLDYPRGLAVTAGGDILISDTFNNRVRIVDANLAAGR